MRENWKFSNAYANEEKGGLKGERKSNLQAFSEMKNKANVYSERKKGRRRSSTVIKFRIEKFSSLACSAFFVVL
jgi:hypothetical protein